MLFDYYALCFIMNFYVISVNTLHSEKKHPPTFSFISLWKKLRFPPTKFSGNV